MSKFLVLFVVLVVCFSASNVQSAPKNIHVHLYNMRKFFAGATAAGMNYKILIMCVVSGNYKIMDNEFVSGFPILNPCLFLAAV